MGTATTGGGSAPDAAAVGVVSSSSSSSSASFSSSKSENSPSSAAVRPLSNSATSAATLRLPSFTFSSSSPSSSGTAATAVPISEKRYEPTHQDQETSDQAAAKHTNPEKETPSSDGQKRRRTSEGGAEGTNPQSQLIEILDRNSRQLTAQLEAQNVNSQLDRDQRKAQVTAMLSILDKLADALGKIADKL